MSQNPCATARFPHHEALLSLLLLIIILTKLMADIDSLIGGVYYWRLALAYWLLAIGWKPTSGATNQHMSKKRERRQRRERRVAQQAAKRPAQRVAIYPSFFVPFPDRGKHARS